ncbi:universal stress protein [Natronobacterium gregoryi]|uniref:Universal stress protein n=2 Tax=Natronobacterium gregoryi TaxID=44930 RepID=L0AMU5_NATGS|nr:universal stress protein [Natronobacterium gregoryi]AFZ74789.1 universal stress protein UspA-like protein [Natronobacterium gregoryi SP2]ELY66120.1 UspA domain-containing protein [Natronobacterium gregoryi SP2]PLK19503.1 universal stress protein [Natronobacterium gregoryi SP2]SFJ43214.1 Nucleotide-binding universal stress protein, UspA family [Natronobacterium gregoryi]
MYRVLLAADEKESRVRTQAEAVVQRAADDHVVDVLYVHEEVTLPDAEWAVGGFFETYAEEMADAIREVDRLPASVEIAIEVLEDAGVEYAVHETVGTPAEAIVETVAEFDSDEVVLGVSKHTPVGKVLFGSVAQAVILDSDRPVTVVPNEPE